MKRVVAAVALATVVLASGVFAMDEAAKQKLDKMETGMAYSMLRGAGNILTGWGEVPRNIWYECQRNAMFGIVTGVSDGSFLAVCRTFGGVADFATFGMTGPGIYNEDLPDFVWQSRWLAPDEKVSKAEKTAPVEEQPAAEKTAPVETEPAEATEE